MKHYLSIKDIDSLPNWVNEARSMKENPTKDKVLGTGKTICLLFFNNSLRTRLSTQKAALNLGMEVMVMNFGNEGWALEYEDGTVMDQGKSEHIKEAAAVVSQYCDIIAVRAFPTLTDKEKDNSEHVLNSFKEFASFLCGSHPTRSTQISPVSLSMDKIISSSSVTAKKILTFCFNLFFINT